MKVCVAVAIVSAVRSPASASALLPSPEWTRLAASAVAAAIFVTSFATTVLTASVAAVDPVKKVFRPSAASVSDVSFANVKVRPAAAVIVSFPDEIVAVSPATALSAVWTSVSVVVPAVMLTTAFAVTAPVASCTMTLNEPFTGVTARPAAFKATADDDTAFTAVNAACSVRPVPFACRRLTRSAIDAASVSRSVVACLTAPVVRLRASSNAESSPLFGVRDTEPPTVTSIVSVPPFGVAAIAKEACPSTSSTPVPVSASWRLPSLRSVAVTPAIAPRRVTSRSRWSIRSLASPYTCAATIRRLSSAICVVNALASVTRCWISAARSVLSWPTRWRMTWNVWAMRSPVSLTVTRTPGSVGVAESCWKFWKNWSSSALTPSPGASSNTTWSRCIRPSWAWLRPSVCCSVSSEKSRNRSRMRVTDVTSTPVRFALGVSSGRCRV